MTKVAERDLAWFNIHPVVEDILKTDARLTLTIDGKYGWVAILNIPDLMHKMSCSDNFEEVRVTGEANYFLHKENIYLIKIAPFYTDNPDRINKTSDYLT